MIIGVVATSTKENERRVPIHPDHLQWIDSAIRENMYLQANYGQQWSIDDSSLVSLVKGVLPREQLFATCDIIVIAKPEPDDLAMCKEGAIVLGWLHFVQQRPMCQVAIDKKLTAITFEGMNIWDKNGNWVSHIFSKNNELAGYCGVFDAFRLKGMDGRYGRLLKAIIFGFGSVSRGAITGLQAQGVSDITVYVLSPAYMVANRVAGVKYLQMFKNEHENNKLYVQSESGFKYPLIDDIATADVIVNAILQNPLNPLDYITEQEVARIKPRALILDISCDKGMGFPFAVPTTFEEPIIEHTGPPATFTYYAVDHTPSYLWDTASREISKALLPFLPDVVKPQTTAVDSATGASGSGSTSGLWGGNLILQKATEVAGGVIQNGEILAFQKREAAYPHNFTAV